MTTCTIIIKIKDYFPKIDTIPYQNYICLFTNGENEGQVPLISQENDSYTHQVKNIVSDIKYKVHVLDYNDMSLIGMCEMVISYNILSQITPPNGFIQEQQKKLLMDLKTKRKLFGTILNMGDIYLNIYSEIYLSEKNNINTSAQNSKSTTTRKKNLISINNSEFRKKLDGSPRTVQKKKLMMQINSDRQILMNLNKNHLNISNLEKQKNLTSGNKQEKNINSAKPNSSFNYKEVAPKENKNNFVKLNVNSNRNRNILKIKAKKNLVSKKLNNDKDPNNLSHNNLINRYKTESNNNNSRKKNKLNNNQNNNQTNKEKLLLKGGVNYFSNSLNKNLLINNISPKLSNENENEELQFNHNTGNKITTIESLENIDFSGKKYITKAKTKKNTSQNNMTSNANNTLFSTNSTEQEINDIDKIILEKNNEIKNSFNIQLKNKNDLNENVINDKDTDYTNKAQLEIKNNLIKLIELYSLLNQKLLKINKKNIILNKKSIIYKEKLFTELKKNNVLTQKKTLAEIKNFLNVNYHGVLNEKFLRAMIKLKKSEFKIYQNIFNLFYYEYDILNFKEYEKNKKMDEDVRIELLLVVFKNLLKNYGNISQIYMNDMTKKKILKNCLNKYGLNEKSEGEINNNIEIPQDDNKNHLNNNNIENKENKNDMDKFRVIKEEDEEKEDELDDEEDKNDIIQNNNIINYSNSNIKENISNEKVKSINKSNKEKNGQKKLFSCDEQLNVENQKISLINNNDNNEEMNNLNIIENHKGIIDDINDLIKENKINEDNKEIGNKIENNKKDDININEKNDDNKENDLEEKEKLNNKSEIKNDEKEIEEVDDKNLIQDREREEKKDIKEKEEELNKIKKEIKKPELKLDDINNEEIENNEAEQLNNNEENKKKIINEMISNNIDSEKDEIKSIKNEKNLGNEVYKKKNKIIEENKLDKEMNKDDNLYKNENKEESNNNREVYKKKNRLRKREEKETIDEEDLKIQKLLIEEFPKKCRGENRFVRITKYEYSFGDEKIKVAYEDDDVILKLDEGDYKLEEFIDILNEGKDEDEEEENNNYEEKEEIYEENEEIIEKEINKGNSSDKKNINEKELNESSGKKGNRKRRKKLVSQDNSQEEENEENSDNENIDVNENEKINKYNENKEFYIDKKEKSIENNNEVLNEQNNINENEINDNANNPNNNRKYVMKRRKDYLLKK